MLGSCPPFRRGRGLGLRTLGAVGSSLGRMYVGFAKYLREGTVLVQTAGLSTRWETRVGRNGWIANPEPKNEKVRLITQPYVLSDKGVRVKGDTPATNNPGVPVR